ncbi:Pentatricopeptide repeat superfamily protein [Hibiscus syriacus]|uniref:Pentatricopeptide repeat superfamily protein n=2 Tax=Hibiscus syriacus TaxID=106335 RepID=A0A6A2WE97_HIBSY|nr:Pentatricopeptide repeat superfamily protein [Hibiscus syriacus]
MKGEDMEIHHFSHHHPLVFMQDQGFASEAASCFGCGRSLEGSSYGCTECRHFLHKECAELALAPEIDHHFHSQHHSTLLPGFPYRGGFCDFCYSGSAGFVYHCASCRFDLHVNCALLQSSIAANVPSYLHQHPLFFLENHNKEIKRDCSGCTKPLSGPIYHCGDCSSKFFNLHKECAELPLEIKHSYDPKHPLTLLPIPPTHHHDCSCYLCKIQWEGFVYSCSICKLELTLDDVITPPKITTASHKHPWKLLLRQMSFICDFCGIAGDHNPYLCTKCNLVVHKKCISMPRSIMITRHHHIISHSYSLPQNEVGYWICRICYEDVDTRYGSYYCSASDCNYIAHVYCAPNKAIWDGTIFLEDNDESCNVTQHTSSNLIIEVVEQTCIGEQMVATGIKHEYHDHNLRLTFSGDIEDDSQCDGCMRPIATHFYSCHQCKFFLHKDCAELPRVKRHPFHKHVLTLTNSSLSPVDGYSICYGCSRPYNGFSYRCYNEEGKSHFNWDIRCISLSDTLEHPCHEHSLFLAHNFPTKCSGCHSEISRDCIAYRCMKRCDFTLDIRCVALPLTTWYKYDRHPLTLTYSDDSSPSQHYCDLCENERNPDDWFYYCADCDNSLHSICTLGHPQFMKLGSEVKSARHPHPLTVVKNIWNCPPCKVCGNLCNGTTLECKESECNFTIHWWCRLQ